MGPTTIAEQQDSHSRRRIFQLLKRRLSLSSRDVTTTISRELHTSDGFVSPPIGRARASKGWRIDRNYTAAKQGAFTKTMPKHEEIGLSDGWSTTGKQTCDHEAYVLPAYASLLGLPRELRDMIFSYVCSDWRSKSGTFNALQTCKQLYHEVSVQAYPSALARVTSEHWPSEHFFRATYLSRIPHHMRHNLRHLALPLPRGMPFDRYASGDLDLELAASGLRLESLVVYSHIPRPLPQISVFGGVLEMDFCLWLKRTLYTMPSLKRICILNYESAAPTVSDMPSPRLIRMLRSSIFEDVLAECETKDEQSYEWQCLTSSLESSMSNCTTDEKTFSIYSSKLGRLVEIVFRSDKFLQDYGLENVVQRKIKEWCDSEPCVKKCPTEAIRPKTCASRRRGSSWDKETFYSFATWDSQDSSILSDAAAEISLKGCFRSIRQMIRWSH